MAWEMGKCPISLITCTVIAIQTELLLTYSVYIYTHMIYVDLLLHSYVPPDPWRRMLLHLHMLASGRTLLNMRTCVWICLWWSARALKPFRRMLLNISPPSKTKAHILIEWRRFRPTERCTPNAHMLQTCKLQKKWFHIIMFRWSICNQRECILGAFRKFFPCMHLVWRICLMPLQ